MPACKGRRPQFIPKNTFLLLDEFGAPWVKVNAAKIGILPNAKFVGVSIERRRD